MLHKIKLSVTTDTAGDGSTVGPNILGKLFAIQFSLGSLASGQADVTVSTVNADGVVTLLTLTNASASAMYYVRHVVHSEAGAALTGTSGGDRTMPILAGAIKMLVAQGGSAKTGSIVVYYEDD
jgi:hypothetical protein